MNRLYVQAIRNMLKSVDVQIMSDHDHDPYRLYIYTHIIYNIYIHIFTSHVDYEYSDLCCLCIQSYLGKKLRMTSRDSDRRLGPVGPNNNRQYMKSMVQGLVLRYKDKTSHVCQSYVHRSWFAYGFRDITFILILYCKWKDQHLKMKF